MPKATKQLKHFPDNFYRVTIKGACVQDGRILLVHESESACDIPGGAWELPGGGLDFGEQPPEGLKREIREEMNLDIRVMSKSPVYVWTNKVEKFRGMKWYYVTVLVYQIEFDSLAFTPSEECDDLKFFSRDELRDVQVGPNMKTLQNIFNPKDFD